jgi:hypothetical protein
MFNADNALDAAVSGATMLGATGMMFLPGNYNALREGMGSVLDDAVAAYDPATVNAFTAYHGSPHTFDRFDINKIGTGEGAQAYGHGLYFAEREGTARAYRDALSQALVDGRPVDYNAGNDLAASWFTAFNDRGKAADYLQRQIDNPPRSLPTLRSPEEIAAMRDAITVLRGDGPISKTQSGGSMYEVQINADPADFLDWDAPLSAQPPVVQDWFDSRGIGPGFAGDQSGGSLYLTENRALDGPQNVSRAMLDGGVKGIRYLDHGSRFNAMDGMGQQDLTRNFVVFDDSIVSILRRYGIGAAVAGGGWALSPEDAQAATDMGILDPQARERQQIVDYVGTL